MSPHKLRHASIVLAVILLAAGAQAGDAYLGISMSSLSPSMSRALQLDDGQGVLVDEVVAESPADEGGVKAGDVIIAIGDHEITGLKSLQKAIGRHEPDEEIKIQVLREGKKKTLKVRLGERPEKQIQFWSDDDGERVWGKSGHKAWHWDTEDGERKIIIDAFGGGAKRGFLGIVPENADDDGVLISEVVDDGPAEEAGLEHGDIIVAIDDEDIDDTDELHDFLGETEPDQTVSVRVERDGKTREFEVELAGTPMAVGILENLERFMPRGPRTFEFHGDDDERTRQILRLHDERADVEELKDELDSLKAELEKLREELNEKK